MTEHAFDPDLGQEEMVPPDPAREEALAILNDALKGEDLDSDGYEGAREALAQLRTGGEPQRPAVHPLIEAMRNAKYPEIALPALEAALAERRPLRVETWGGQTEPERRWLLADWIPLGRCTMIAGPGGIGKSRLILQLAVGVASGGGDDGQWLFGTNPTELALGAAVRNGAPVVYASWEDEPSEQRRRLADIASNTTSWCTPFKLQELYLADMVAEGATWGRVSDGYGGTAELLPAGVKLRRLAERKGARVLVLDAVAAAYSGNENDRGQVRSFVANWDAWARDNDCAVVIVAHPPKSGDAFSGSTDWSNAARAGITLTKEKFGPPPPKKNPPKDDRPYGWKLALVKANYAASKVSAFRLDLDVKGGVRWQVVGEWEQGADNDD